MSLPCEKSVEVNNLDYGYGGPLILKNLSLELKPGSRCILIGANGAGKTTLLRILAGKRLVDGDVKIMGKHAFLDAPPYVTYLGTEWAGNPVVRADLTVSYLLKSMGSARWPDRTERLLRVLDVDLEWRLHQVSDGQRRRIQLVMGLLQPWNLLLLDEVTVDLDVWVRAEFLNFLREETEERNASVVYATHIFDGMGSWPTHLAHVSHGQVLTLESIDSCKELEEIKTYHRENNVLDSPLMGLCFKWLLQDKQKEDKEKVKVNATTGLPSTKWDALSNDMKKHGDKYYNYWK
ncbi:P-loop containing nucleoside triphosphate hydrolase protein [Spinellus fusiger]|nr:P-loop containing nucleoside triphosphate hydrolase protein [Spinellus fusiger]